MIVLFLLPVNTRTVLWAKFPAFNFKVNSSLVFFEYIGVVAMSDKFDWIVNIRLRFQLKN